jgi:hypothetical protein
LWVAGVISVFDTRWIAKSNGAYRVVADKHHTKHLVKRCLMSQKSTTRSAAGKAKPTSASAPVLVPIDDFNKRADRARKALPKAIKEPKQDGL